jgi:uncharacterized protein YbcI
MKTRGEAEADICQAVIRFEKEYLGRGPLETRAFIIDDMVLVRLRKVLTQAELKLAQTADPARGRYLIKQLRQELIESGREMLDAEVHRILGVAVKSLHTDISTVTGERVIVFTLEERPKFRGDPERGG